MTSAPWCPIPIGIAAYVSFDTSPKERQRRELVAVENRYPEKSWKRD
jgi:hypothetical protein